jgi:hypothetical protein
MTLYNLSKKMTTYILILLTGGPQWSLNIKKTKLLEILIITRNIYLLIHSILTIINNNNNSIYFSVMKT